MHTELYRCHITYYFYYDYVDKIMILLRKKEKCLKKGHCIVYLDNMANK